MPPATGRVAAVRCSEDGGSRIRKECTMTNACPLRRSLSTLFATAVFVCAPAHAAEELEPLQSPIVFDRSTVLSQAGASASASGAGGVELKKSGQLWGENKSYVIPALEIVGFDTLLNLFDRAYFGGDDFDVTGSSIRRNLRRG